MVGRAAILTLLQSCHLGSMGSAAMMMMARGLAGLCSTELRMSCQVDGWSLACA